MDSEGRVWTIGPLRISRPDPTAHVVLPEPPGSCVSYKARLTSLPSPREVHVWPPRMEAYGRQKDGSK